MDIVAAHWTDKTRVTTSLTTDSNGSVVQGFFHGWSGTGEDER